MIKEAGQTTSDYVSLDDTCGGCSTDTYTYRSSTRGVSCPYSGRCSDYHRCCDSCRHNTAKRSYYEPEKKYPSYPYEPCYPYYPYYPTWYPDIICDTSTSWGDVTDGTSDNLLRCHNLTS